MRAEILLHKLLGKTIHKSRIKLLDSLVTGLLMGKQLKHSALGRSLSGQISERSGIRKVDRFLENKYFQTNFIDIYAAIVRITIGNKMRPAICVDWTKLPNVNEYALRASLVAQGRAITLYEEVHKKKNEGNATVHRNFLLQLKKILPMKCKPIIITDAGFKNPWFKAIRQLEWDFVGRVRGQTCYGDSTGFHFCEELHQQASCQPKYLGDKVLTKKNPVKMGFYIIKQKLQGRKSYTRSGKIRKDKDSKNFSRSYREPWLLVSSITGAKAAKKVVELYKGRMSIEEAFRDMKSSQYGFGMDTNHTLKSARLIVWLLLAALASLIAWIIGYVAEQSNLHYQFQANSIRHRRVLSYFYLGCQVFRKKIDIPINLSDINFAKEEIFI